MLEIKKFLYWILFKLKQKLIHLIFFKCKTLSRRDLCITMVLAGVTLVR